MICQYRKINLIIIVSMSISLWAQTR